jgi:hypothetical protein
VPNTSDLNLTPTSIALPSPESGVSGVTPWPQMLHGHDTLTVSPADAVSRLPLSSTARARMLAVGAPWATHE